MPNSCYGRIYLVTNTVNGKVYVGQTKNTLEIRWGQYRSEARHRKGKARPIIRALRKYGPGVFTIEELEQCADSVTLNQAEIRHIIERRALICEGGYNCTTGGEDSYQWTEDSRARLSRSRKAYYAAHPEIAAQISEMERKRAEDPVVRERLTRMSRSYNGSEEGRLRHSEVSKISLSKPETKARMSEAQKRRHALRTPEERELFRQAKAKEQLARWAEHRIDHPWATEQEVHEFIQGLTVKEYCVKRRGLTKYPKQASFQKVYGKTFKEIRDGSRRGSEVMRSVHGKSYTEIWDRL